MRKHPALGCVLKIRSFWRSDLDVDKIANVRCNVCNKIECVFSYLCASFTLMEQGLLHQEGSVTMPWQLQFGCQLDPLIATWVVSIDISQIISIISTNEEECIFIRHNSRVSHWLW